MERERGDDAPAPGSPERRELAELEGALVTAEKGEGMRCAWGHAVHTTHFTNPTLRLPEACFLSFFLL
jgi:hypothetical protein